MDDGGDGGGIILGDAPWAKSALQSAEEVVAEFNGSLALFAFKASKESSLIRLRLDKFSDKYVPVSYCTAVLREYWLFILLRGSKKYMLPFGCFKLLLDSGRSCRKVHLSFSLFIRFWVPA